MKEYSVQKLGHLLPMMMLMGQLDKFKNNMKMRSSINVVSEDLVNSGLLELSCGAVKDLQTETSSDQQGTSSLSLRYKLDKKSKKELLREGGDLVSSKTLKELELPIFDFLCTERNRSFSIHRGAITLFEAHFKELPSSKLRFPVGSRVVGAFIMPCGNCFYYSKGHDDLCEDFLAYNRSKGTLYDVFTAYGAMAHAAQVRPGDSVAMIGVGGVGSREGLCWTFLNSASSHTHSGIFNLADAVTRKYGFEEAGKAFQDLNQGKIVSRAVVEIMLSSRLYSLNRNTNRRPKDLVNSGLLELSCGAVKDLQTETSSDQQGTSSLSLRYKLDKKSKKELLREGGDLVSSKTLKELELPIFDFLCTERNRSFSIHRGAITLFEAHFKELPSSKLRFPVGSRVVGAFIMPCGNCFYYSKGHDDLCEDFLAYNRSKGTLYDVFTAYGAMAHAAQVRPGDSVAMIGVGGVGSREGLCWTFLNSASSHTHSGIFNLADAVTRKYGFEEAGKAFQDLNQGKIVSRAVVEIMLSSRLYSLNRNTNRRPKVKTKKSLKEYSIGHIRRA
ncbi:hypothetical protein SADUNF_Sadunf19G0024900 [Salix dunnii]|uniref:Uncharacterized protein n=1 Tax=Salix dunnii TaxID=1413687 RepID=A0A835J1K5_9ROSI|nr:hypothetical protein SADUNF_Sadunf19G0024900 [Salix dunnii]